MVFDRPAGPWRDSQRAALEDAVQTGNATRDDHSGTVYLTVPARIERRGPL